MIGQLYLDAHLPERGNLYTHWAPYKPEGIQECPLSILYSFILILMEFFKVWNKHHFCYIQYISLSVYIHSDILCHFRSVSAYNMNWVILHYVQEATILEVVFFHTPRHDSTSSGCESCNPWWWLLASQGMITSVWNTDTGDTSETHNATF